MIYRRVPAMLKVALIPEEARGSRQLAWWAGAGAARVLEIDGDAVLLERALGAQSLVNMARTGLDPEATSIIVAVAAMLHRPNSAPPPELVSLEEWFESLFAAAISSGGEFRVAAAMAERLLISTPEAIPLHGDLHHWNVLDFGGCWRAIDPKGLVGDRAFDLIHLLRNPDRQAALAPGRLRSRVDQVAQEAVVDRVRLLEWAVAFAGLSAAWATEDGESPQADLAMLRAASAILRE